jgi:hypothetical protein
MLSAGAVEKPDNGKECKMSAPHEKRTILQIAVIGLLMATVGLAGCQTLFKSDIGRQVPSGDWVIIQDGGPHAQIFQTGDMTVKYQYWKAGNQLKVLGSTAIKYESINELTFHLFFLDGQGTVIEVHDFYSFLDHSDFIDFKSNARKYHRDFTIPDGAKAFAIGYAGKTGRTADQPDVDFSYSPLE